MEQFIQNFVNNFGYWGVFLLIAIENLFPPIPSEIILTLGGFMTTYTELNVWWVIIAATAGSVAGAIVLYFIGRILDVSRLEKLFDSKLGRMLRLKKEDVGKAEGWFSKRGKRTVFLCRFVPIVRSLISIPAGSAKMNFGSFLILTTFGTLIWNVVLVWLGRIAGDAWEKIAGYFDLYSTIALFFFIAVAGIIAIIFIKKRFFNKKAE